MKFKSTSHKISFKTQQVSKEIQGIEVSGLLVWSVLAESPLKAFHSLGTDLLQDTPANSNACMTTMCNSIVRSCIANATIDDILTQRKEVRDKLQAELGTISKGWGIKIETIEITDVSILSSSLFNNIQAKFKEEQKLKATLDKLDIKKQLRIEQSKSNILIEQKRADSSYDKTLYNAKDDLELEKKNLNKFKQSQELELKKYKQDLANRLQKHTKVNESTKIKAESDKRN